MRIIAGRFKGRVFPSCGSSHVRPTSDRVREAIFSALGDRVENARVLDLFAGTGIFGLEALSRHASSVTFVDRDRALTERVKEAARTLGVLEDVTILRSDVLRALHELERDEHRFDIVFLDPPYDSDWILRLLTSPALLRVLAPDGTIVVERSVRGVEIGPTEGLRKSLEKKYGETRVEFFEHSPAQTPR